MDFDTAKAHLDKLGIRYIQAYGYRGQPGVDRARHDLPLFTHVGLGWSAEDWYAAAANAGDEYMGGCCGNLSGAQDEVCGWFRSESTSIPIRDMAGVIEILLIPHDGFEQFEDGDWVVEGATDADSMVALAWARWADLPAYDKMAVVWKLVKDSYTPEIPTGRWPKDEPEEKAEDAMAVLSKYVRRLDITLLFSGWAGEENKKHTSQKRAERAVTLAKMIPALRQVNDHILSLDLGNFDGWALIDLTKEESEGGEADTVCTNGYGHCFYEHMHEVEKILALWKRDDNENEERKDEKRIEHRIGIRPVRVGWEIEDGYEFTGPVERVETILREA